MPRTLPVSPTVGSFFDTGTDRYSWNGSAWNLVSSTSGIKPSGSASVSGLTYSVATTISTFTITGTGKFIITGSICHGCSSGYTIIDTLLDSSSNVLATGQIASNTGAGYIYAMVGLHAIVSVNGSATYTVRSAPTGGVVDSLTRSSLIWFQI